jgi:shikimate dehydrogenase
MNDIASAVTKGASPQPVIAGPTRLYVIIGDPVAQVKSPGVYNARFAAAGMDTVFVPAHVPAEGFEETMRGLMRLGNLDGLMITVPFKSRIMPLVDRVLPMGEKVGAINAVRRESDGSWTGDMFDGTGLIRGLKDRSITMAGRKVMLVGAGGGGSAVAVAVADAGAEAVSIFDADAAKAEALAARVAKACPACRTRHGAVSFDDHDTFINATPIGMAPGDGPPVPLVGLRPDMLVIDIIMKPEVTPLLAAAHRLGCTTIGGRAMLEGQAEEVAAFYRIGTPR